MSTEDKFDNATEKLGGQAKEGVGKLTGDRELETEGQVDQSKAGLKDKVQDAKDTVTCALKGLKKD